MVMRNQIYRGVKHAAQTKSKKLNNSNLTYRGISHKQDNAQRTIKLSAQMNYRGLSYLRV